MKLRSTIVVALAAAVAAVPAAHASHRYGVMPRVDAGIDLKSGLPQARTAQRYARLRPIALRSTASIFPALTVTPADTVVAATASEGFAWRDAGLGALVGAFAALVAAAAIATARRVHAHRLAV